MGILIYFTDLLKTLAVKSKPVLVVYKCFIPGLPCSLLHGAAAMPTEACAQRLSVLKYLYPANTWAPRASKQICIIIEGNKEILILTEKQKQTQCYTFGVPLTGIYNSLYRTLPRAPWGFF